MRLILLALCALMLVSCSQTYPTFSQYCVSFNKIYTLEEASFREGVYNAKIESFASITNFVPGVNNFTDWTSEELKSLYSLQQLPESQRVSSGPLSSGNRLGAPASVDLRTKNIITSIKNQQDCGACWAFTTAALVQAYLVYKGKNPLSIDLSEQFLVDCTADNTCNGGMIQPAMDRVKTKFPLQTAYPYLNAQGQSNPSICSSNTGVDTGFTRKSYYSISDAQMIDMLQKQPVAVGVDATDWSSYSSGNLACSTNPTINHAVVLVGYTADAYIVKNSWDTTWGMNGYAYLTRNTATNCKVLDQAHIIQLAGGMVVGMVGAVLVGIALMF